MPFPVSTYRLQFRGGMDFDRAIGVVTYLKRLGITHQPDLVPVEHAAHGAWVTAGVVVVITVIATTTRALDRSGLSLTVSCSLT